MSHQRLVILEELKKRSDHPTADDLYPVIKKIIPSVSLATVYRNLNWLADKGFILKMETSGKMRFDGTPEHHDHFHCDKCNSIFDLPKELKPEVIADAYKEATDHSIEGYHLKFHGICAKCKYKIRQ